MPTSPSSLITRASRYRPTQHSCNRRIEATLYTSSHVARTNPRSAAIGAHRSNNLVHAPTVPRHHHLPPRNQSRKLKFDSRVSNRLDLHRFSADWTGCNDRSNPRSAAIGAHRSNNLVHAPTAPRHHHLPPRDQSRKLKFDSRVSNRLAHRRCRYCAVICCVTNGTVEVPKSENSTF